VRVLATVLLSATLLVATALTAGPATASTRGDIVSWTNSARADHGLSRLSVASDLSSVAQQHAEWMAAHRALEHTSGLGSKVCCWVSIGENIGYGGSAGAIFNAFMGSSSHRANILSTRFTQIGVGAARASNGDLYVDQVFRRPSGAVSASAPSAPRASRSGARAPLQRSTSVRLSPAQLREAMIARRLTLLRPTLGGDPLRRSVGWIVSMSRLTVGTAGAPTR
jgi:hypothetical protein